VKREELRGKSCWGRALEGKMERQWAARGGVMLFSVKKTGSVNNFVYSHSLINNW